MARDVDKKKTRKALRKLKQVAERAGAQDGADLTDWEKDFVSGVQERLETYGSAFRDPTKGALDEALSQRQTQVVRALDKKTREKAKTPLKTKKPLKTGSGFKRKSPAPRPRVRDVREDIETEPAPVEEASEARETAPTPEMRRAGLRVIEGGAKTGDTDANDA